jgi:hypothetical protein
MSIALSGAKKVSTGLSAFFHGSRAHIEILGAPQEEACFFLKKMETFLS